MHMFKNHSKKHLKNNFADHVNSKYLAYKLKQVLIAIQTSVNRYCYKITYILQKRQSSITRQVLFIILRLLNQNKILLK